MVGSGEGAALVEARIAVKGSDRDRESLLEWLRREPELRGHVRLSSSATPAEAMGVPADVVVVQAGAALAGAGAMWAALARSLTVWLSQRRCDLTVRVTGRLFAARPGRLAVRLPDPLRSRAVLIGTGRYQCPDLT
jgi:hypothetical protein